MNQTSIDPKFVTKPIQLLAAWLAGLIAIEIAFLTAAVQIKSPDWASGILVIAAVCFVPLFLVMLFILQTRFRPQMQEDLFYFQYLKDTITRKDIDLDQLERVNLTNKSKAMGEQIETSLEELFQKERVNLLEILAIHSGNEAILGDNLQITLKRVINADMSESFSTSASSSPIGARVPVTTW